MADNPYNPDTLLSYEAKDLRQLHTAWKCAVAGRNFELADKLRNQLMEWQESLSWLADGEWHPFFEPIEHRNRRIRERMTRYGIEIHPFTKDSPP